MENIPVDGELDRNSHHGENKDSPGPSTVVTNNDEQPITPGKMNQHQGKEAYFTPTKELLQPCLSPGTAHGFDKGKDDALQSKDDSAYSMSKSKSESKLFNGSEKDISQSASKLTKKESLKVQKKNYREEKKRATRELLSTITDPSVIVMADWLKIRGTLKSWTKLWCVLKPGVLLLYKTPKNDQWVGTVLLNVCELIERPSKKDGFCFKLFHPLEQTIWATKGPRGEAVGAITLPLPGSYLIVRAASESDGRCWMDALELALKCSSLLKRTMIREGKEHDLNSSADSTHVSFYGLLRANNLHSGENLPLNDSEIDRQPFKDQDTYSDKSDKENDHDHEESENDALGKSEESDSDTSERQDDSYVDPEPADIRETTYLEQSHEELGEAGEAAQTEEVSEENKSFIWTLLKQVRPGMDLSKVVLPTFILEPRSFLDKLSDYYYHADFLSEAALEENAYNRMKKVVKWYLSGFYKKPKGLKKPYNPILGEFFRCMWIHPRTNSKTFYIAEQVSHHPPISAFYVSNRKDGFCLSGSILAKSKFYGNSLSAILDGEGRLTFLNRGEDYVMTMPYAHCKGILYGTMTLELGGIVNITCEKTGYSATIEFKLKPFLGNNDSVNQISGRIKLGKEVLAFLEGHWDSEVTISDKKTGVSETFWNPTSDIKQRRLHRYTVKFEEQDDFESEKLWQQVTKAINNKDQTEATQEKYILEEAQRKSAKDRKLKGEVWTCKLFDQDAVTGEWHYKYADTRPWDPLNDMIQFEKDGTIQTKVRHRTPMVTVPKIKRKPGSQKMGECGFSSPEPDNQDSSGSEAQLKHNTRIRKKGAELGELQSAIESIKETQEDIKREIMALRNRVISNSSPWDYHSLQFKHYVFIVLMVLLQLIINFLFK
ncbi:oxysterol-binding protein-related protein 8 isoform X1 [Oenanthe melanoleuca]|uniref:oxysterol-binding protein-related protein 8 isoform X1 n=2 Tax=Oenanthe melanoleuca TaxID=2939378 RepID=UPI0024C1BC6D|nr:oxysterol-binding protein-related protein 8 isoform X1 [Oenanthe melanoleuca]XP_056365872.1 oxysterol-binding protein-related protein 8 isoform X1 [Oenanthe melanoleuca]XP_056365885.1 oxysterol-binding protein-related protein 8 isoform X1 [Oenanthe melanoleuca]